MKKIGGNHIFSGHGQTAVRVSPKINKNQNLIVFACSFNDLEAH